MTMERSASIMDAIFASQEEEAHARLLKIIQEFLISEAGKHSSKEKGMQNGNSPVPVFVYSYFLRRRQGKNKKFNYQYG